MQASGFEVVDSRPGGDALDRFRELVAKVVGDQRRHGVADDFLGGEAVQALGTSIPRLDRSVERHGDDCVVGRLDKCGVQLVVAIVPGHVEYLLHPIFRNIGIVVDLPYPASNHVAHQQLVKGWLRIGAFCAWITRSGSQQTSG